jgi:hypothetical protein
MVELINSKYDSTNTTGETGILFGWNNHVAARITAFKESTNRTGFKIIGEAGFNVPTTIATFRSTGRLGIGTTSPSYPLEVSGNASGTSIYASHDIVAYSDQSVKENVRPIENALERVEKSRGVLYDRTDTEARNNIGFIAQELEQQFPELVVTNPDGTKAVKYQNATAVLFEAVKELKQKLDNQEERLLKLEQLITKNK